MKEGLELLNNIFVIFFTAFVAEVVAEVVAVAAGVQVGFFEADTVIIVFIISSMTVLEVLSIGRSIGWK